MFTNTYTETRRSFDSGLRLYFLAVYNYIALALAITGVFAYASLNFAPLARIIYQMSPGGQIFGLSGIGYLCMFAPVLLSFYLFASVANMELRKAQTLFLGYSGLMGISLSSLGLMYTGTSLVKTFFICSSAFAGMSIYGYSTNKDLTSMGSFVTMGLIGIVITSVINLFMQSSAIYFATSFLGIFIFMGLIAWDTQKLKVIYYQTGGGEQGQKMAVLGALTLYLDFINLFIYMLRFFGSRRD